MFNEKKANDNLTLLFEFFEVKRPASSLSLEGQFKVCLKLNI
jgi:hypothetical protein